MALPHDPGFEWPDCQSAPENDASRAVTPGPSPAAAPSGRSQAAALGGTRPIHYHRNCQALDEGKSMSESKHTKPPASRPASGTGEQPAAQTPGSRGPGQPPGGVAGGVTPASGGRPHGAGDPAGRESRSRSPRPRGMGLAQGDRPQRDREHFAVAAQAGDAGSQDGRPEGREAAAHG